MKCKIYRRGLLSGCVFFFTVTYTFEHQYSLQVLVKMSSASLILVLFIETIVNLSDSMSSGKRSFFSRYVNRAELLLCSGQPLPRKMTQKV